MEQLKELIELEKEKDLLSKQMAAIVNEIHELRHPYKNGEIISVCGYSHNGKMMKVTNTETRFEDSEIKMLVHGVVLKKDGTESANSATWSSYYDPFMKLVCDGINNSVAVST